MALGSFGERRRGIQSILFVCSRLQDLYLLYLFLLNLDPRHRPVLPPREGNYTYSA